MSHIPLKHFGCLLALSTQYTEYLPEGEPVGDILFLRDSSENHLPLFQAWGKRGFRVIAIDLPSHGKTSGATLNWAESSGLSQYVAKFIEDPSIRPSSRRPLLLSGWSTGGLLALRMLRLNAFQKSAIKPSGLILLKINSWFAQLGDLPPDLPTMVVFGGDETDRDINTAMSRRWFERQIKHNHRPVWGIQFPHGFHERDNDPDPTGTLTRSLTANFAATVVAGNTEIFGEARINEFR